MESSGSGPSPECGAGSIVWVRRRNGSWWPGKILGPEELPASHLTSPRTGTPVKLLGREDASVDWYNLEKSKRVKAFRCGEFDDCIERAESSQGMPPKKREKYARREDAILHALELEKQLLRKQGKLDITPDNASSKSPSAMKLDAGDSDISNGKPGNSIPNQFLKRQQDTSKRGEIIGSPLQCEKEKGGNQPTSENDHAEFMPRMKGLQDLGLKSASAKEKLVFSGVLDGSSKPIVGGTQDTSNKGPTTGRTCDEKGEEHMGGIFRAKRSRCMHLPSEPGDGLDYKEMHPNHEMSTSRFRESDSYPFVRHLIEDNSSEFMEDVESGSSESTSSELESESDSSQTEPDIDEEMASLSGAAVATEFKLDAMGRAEALEECGSMSTDESDDSSLSGDISHLYPHDHHSVNEAVSKWRLKGKRNMRNLVKRSIDADSRGFSGSTFRQRSIGQSSYRNDCFYDDVDGTGFTAKDSRIDMVGFVNGEYSRTLRASKDRGAFSRNIIDWEHMTCENRAALKRHWDDRAGHFDPLFVGQQYFGGRTRSMLMDVDLKVQASYQKGPVPIVSLMSKLDGKAIIGHPIQIEALEDGSSETLLPTNGYSGNGLINPEVNTSLPSAWRTAKRTNFRVPRPHLSSTLGGDEGVEDHSFLHQERQQSLNKYNVGTFEHKASLLRKNLSHISRSPFDRKFQKKMPKRVLSSSQKTRTLSSIGIEQTLGTRPIQDRSSCQMDGLIKPESFRPTTVACIPVKLVFSRLLEKINRPPSKAVSRMIVPTGYAVRDSS
ncbi:hypothetical protein SLE2022_053640 [Rubroshorea leprosula]